MSVMETPELKKLVAVPGGVNPGAGGVDPAMFSRAWGGYGALP